MLSSRFFRVDLSRIHVTGFFMGGYGTWDLALHTPDRFASLALICGGGDTRRASLVSRIPHWVHHGELDDIIDISQSKKMVERLKKAGADVRFTTYPDVAHDSWTAAHSTLELWQWMLGTTKKVSGEAEILLAEDKARGA
jgi:predicted peptidase